MTTLPVTSRAEMDFRPFGPLRDSRPGTYALLLELSRARELRVGRLGRTAFDAPFYLYLGSAFGPGGLVARLRHHLRYAQRAHWHIDYLRREARVVEVWVTRDPERLECVWFAAALRLRGARAVAGFGSSDCACASHLVAVQKAPKRAAFRRHLHPLAPSCAPIARLSAPCDEKAAGRG